MTNKQLNLCLQLQGLIFTVGTICVALIIGLPLGYALFSYAKHNGIFGMNIYHVPIVPILIMIFLVGLLQIVLSCVFVVIFMIMVFAIFINPMSPTIAINR